MKVIAVVSAKGGVGKTTVCTNLAAALRLRGKAVLVVDLDPQNAVASHLGTGVNPANGIGAAFAGADDWRDLCGKTKSGIHVLAFGQPSEAVRDDLESKLRNEPDFLACKLRDMRLPENMVVLLDTPPGPSVYLKQALAAANVALLVLLCDAGSYATVPMSKRLIDTYCQDRPGFIGYACVVNQVDVSRQLNRDVLQGLKAFFGSRIVGLVHQDQAVAEALACQESVLLYAAHSQASADFIACAAKVDDMAASATAGAA